MVGLSIELTTLLLNIFAFFSSFLYTFFFSSNSECYSFDTPRFPRIVGDIIIIISSSFFTLMEVNYFFKFVAVIFVVSELNKRKRIEKVFTTATRSS